MVVVVVVVSCCSGSMVGQLLCCLGQVVGYEYLPVTISPGKSDGCDG